MSYRPPAWLRKWVERQQSARRAYCGTPLSVGAAPVPGAHRAVADLLVTVNAGGLAHQDNAVLCSAPCKHQWGAKDWPGFNKARDRNPAISVDGRRISGR